MENKTIVVSIGSPVAIGCVIALGCICFKTCGKLARTRRELLKTKCKLGLTEVNNFLQTLENDVLKKELERLKTK